MLTSILVTTVSESPCELQWPTLADQFFLLYQVFVLCCVAACYYCNMSYYYHHRSSNRSDPQRLRFLKLSIQSENLMHQYRTCTEYNSEMRHGAVHTISQTNISKCVIGFWPQRFTVRTIQNCSHQDLNSSSGDSPTAGSKLQVDFHAISKTQPA